jgi:hypothetical protein
MPSSRMRPVSARNRMCSYETHHSSIARCNPKTKKGIVQCQILLMFPQTSKQS